MAGAWFHTTSVPATLLSLPALSAASRRALEHDAGASKPAFEEEWRTTIPAVVSRLGDEACASFVAFLRREVSSCSHDADDFVAWAESEGAPSSASADTLYATLAKNLPSAAPVSPRRISNTEGRPARCGRRDQRRQKLGGAKLRTVLSERLCECTRVRMSHPTWHRRMQK